jgi:Flp pilus assembly pilin Flp
MITSCNVLRTWLAARLDLGERGANLVEYILLIVFIALIVVVAVAALEDEVTSEFNDASTCLDGGTAPC